MQWLVQAISSLGFFVVLVLGSVQEMNGAQDPLLADPLENSTIWDMTPSQENEVSAEIVGDDSVAAEVVEDEPVRPNSTPSKNTNSSGQPSSGIATGFIQKNNIDSEQSKGKNSSFGATSSSSVKSSQEAIFSRALVNPEQTRVAILGYHDFTQTGKITEMRMRVSDFRSQMQRIKDSGITVITLEQLIQWKQGSLKLPAQCILITLDDGWKAVYTEAYPIMKEFGFPFTLCIYTQFVNSGGASLTWGQLKDMMAHGASIASHSHTHPVPRTFRARYKEGPEKFAEFMAYELDTSKHLLESNLGIALQAYCYPGGNKFNGMKEALKKSGYLVAFDVLPGKVQLSTDNLELPRYMVLGTHLSTFEGCLKFNDGGNAPVKGGRKLGQTGNMTIGPVPAQTVYPSANTKSEISCPKISINLTQEQNLDVDSLAMVVSGFGRVAAVYDQATKCYTWQSNRALQGDVKVFVTWKNQVVPPSKEKPLLKSAEWWFSMSPHHELTTPEGWIP